MSKPDEFMAVVNTLKSTSPSITAEQRIGLLRQAVQEHGLSADEASAILDASGLVIGEQVNYFEILGVSIEELQDQNETDIAARVDAAHEQHYNASLRAGGRVRPDGRTEEQWRVLLNHARDTLKEPQKREAYISDLQRDKDDAPLGGSALPIFKFPNGDEATSIQALADLMAKNVADAMDALYRGYLEQSLGRAGEMHFATAARAVVTEFPNNRELGLKAITDILKGKMTFEKGSETQTLKPFEQEMVVEKQNEAATPQQIALMIDPNWEQARNLLYNGFIALWFEYTQQPELANIAKEITTHYSAEEDIGLEMLVQKLHPQIGRPEIEVSPTHIDLGTIDMETQKTIQLEIKNVGRGFLYGTVELADKVQGFQLASSPIRGQTVATIKLDASQLAVKRKYEVAVLINTNSGNVEAPISCYVDYPIMKSIRRVAVSGAIIAAVAVVARLMVRNQEWLGTGFSETGFVNWTWYWSWLWTEWSDKWLWIDWKVYTLNPPKTGLGFFLALVALIGGIIGYRFFFFKKHGKKHGKKYRKKYRFFKKYGNRHKFFKKYGAR